MLELNAQNVVAHLQQGGRLPPKSNTRVEHLAWGVSNVVLRISPAGGRDFVIKQSRRQLRTETPWFSRLDRIWREVAVMRTVGPLLPAGVVPEILFEERENYWFAMEAVAADHVVWKQDLLDGHVDASIARRLGTYLATVHRDTSSRPDLQQALGDREVFVQLRIEPFYHRLAEKYPDIRGPMDAMVDEMFATAICLVHADFSPKNILVTPKGISLVDFETGHFGDPAFDLGFFLSHLLLKTVMHAERFEEYVSLTTEFWEAYLAQLGVHESGPFAVGELQRRCCAHLAGCMWARIDATSPVDYLPGELQRAAVRDFCRQLMHEPPANWPSVLELLKSLLRDLIP